MLRQISAAFFRVEGTLVDRGALAASAYLASNDQGMVGRAARFGLVAAFAPLRGILAKSDPTLATRGVYLALRHMSEDRVCELGNEYYEDVLKGRLYERGKELLKQARKSGHRVVLVSEGIEQVVAPLVQSLGVDDYVCNRLEIVDGEVTGKLVEPVIGGHDVGRWVRDYAARHDIDLARSYAYAAQGADLLLLSAVGNPCAVNADLSLRGAARDADWPTLEYR